jgi:NAD-dependent dihydropyrimidine dehydrogenase PreA subunit
MAAKVLNRVFIDIEVEESVARDPEVAAKLEEVCPVDIFGTRDDGTVEIVDANVDECVLCELCLDAAPNRNVTVRKLYDGSELKR